MVKSSYDVICFNNCIEFRMELCEPLTNNQVDWQQKGICFKQIKQDLSERLALMHSLGLIHCDIKPENVLYSPQRQAFVYGDFGMALLSK
jgi:serine/threonine protein kinase